MLFNFGKKNFESIGVYDIGSMLGKINLIDVREKNEYSIGHVPKAKNIPMGTIMQDSDKYLDKTKQYHIICHSGARSNRVCKDLSSKGYSVVNVEGGTGRYPDKLTR